MVQWKGVVAVCCLSVSLWRTAECRVDNSVKDVLVDSGAAAVVANGGRSGGQFYRDPIMSFIYESGKTVQEILESEAKTWHWYPWKHVQYEWRQGDTVPVEKECVKENSLDDLPEDFFTQEQRQSGAVLLHLMAAIYFFTLLAVVCNNYFLPAVECICEDLHISEDVAAATFMSIATTTPELFTNLISTFVTDSDMGLGTILGSMLFNTLGVAAVGGLASVKPVKLDWFPLTRDSIIFSINLCILISVAWDGYIMWYEATLLFLLFLFYFAFVISNHRWEKFFRNSIESRFNWCRPLKDEDVEEEKIPEQPRNQETHVEKKDIHHSAGDERPHTFSSMFTVPEGSLVKRMWWFYSWPIQVLLTMFVPNPKVHRKLYPLTFILCILLIGANSYLVYWMVAIIGHTIDIPESVMGMTLLAGGGCLPEAISCVILIRRGEGGFGISNSLGANSLAILMSLGVPWFVKTMIEGASTTNAHIAIQSYGIEFTISFLLIAVLTMYIILSWSRYRLRKTVGIIMISAYLVFIVLAILVELDILFPSGNVC